MKGNKERIIPKKNYLILLILIFALIGFTMYCSSWYKEIKNYYYTNSIITDVISEIEINSLSSYLQDNPEVIIYLAASNDYEIKNFEKDFKKLIVNKNLTDSIVYLDLSKEKNNQTIDIIKNNYLPSNLKKVSDIYVPNMIYFKDGVVNDILYTKKNNISKDDVSYFLIRNEIIEK